MILSTIVKKLFLLKTIPNSRLEYKNHNLFDTKMAKIHTLFLNEKAKNHTL